MAKSELKSDFKKSGLFVLSVVVLLFVASFALTAGRGFEDQAFKDKFFVYVTFAIIGTVGIVGALGYNFINGKRLFVVPLHEPEESSFGFLRLVRSPWLLGLFTLVVFFPVSFWAGTKNVFFSSIPQQISQFSNVFGDSVLPALSENLLFMVVLIGLLSFAFWLRNRFKSDFVYGFFKFVVIPLVGGFLWVVFHNLVYGSSESAQLFTFVFGVTWILVTMVTFSFVPGSVLHFVTNFAVSIKVRGLYSSDLFLFELWSVYFVLLLIMVWFLLKKKVRASA